MRIISLILALTLISVAVGSAITDDAAESKIEKTLTDLGIQGVMLKVADGRPNGGTKGLWVGYTSTSEDPGSIGHEIGQIMGVWLAVVKSGWDCDELGAFVSNTKVMERGSWYCKKDWKNMYFNGELTQEQLGAKVIGTLQPL